MERAPDRERHADRQQHRHGVRALPDTAEPPARAGRRRQDRVAARDREHDQACQRDQRDPGEDAVERTRCGDSCVRRAERQCGGSDEEHADGDDAGDGQPGVDRPEGRLDADDDERGCDQPRDRERAEARSVCDRLEDGDNGQRDQRDPSRRPADPRQRMHRARAEGEEDDRRGKQDVDGSLQGQTPDPIHDGPGYVSAMAYPERIVPDETPPGPVAIHEKRYRFALPHCTGKRVLDAACGVGYGTALLADTAAEVVGVDVSEDAIAYARSRYARPNVEFRVEDLLRPHLDDRSFDVVCSFETIEHLPDRETYLEHVGRVLRDDGVLHRVHAARRRDDRDPGQPASLRRVLERRLRAAPASALRRASSSSASGGSRPAAIAGSSGSTCSACAAGSASCAGSDGSRPARIRCRRSRSRGSRSTAATSTRPTCSWPSAGDRAARDDRAPRDRRGRRRRAARRAHARTRGEGAR